MARLAWFLLLVTSIGLKVEAQDQTISQSSTDILDIRTTSSSMVDINDGSTPDSKCGIPKPGHGGHQVTRPVLVVDVAGVTQEYFGKLKPQVEAKLGYNFTYFIADCYLRQLQLLFNGYGYNVQVNIGANHCIRIQAFQSVLVMEPLELSSVQDNMPCEEEQDQVNININDGSDPESNDGSDPESNGGSILESNGGLYSENATDLGEHFGQCGNPDIWPCNTGRSYVPVAPGVCPHNLKPLPTCFCTFGPCICCELPQQ